MRTIAKRLLPGQNLRKEIEQLVQDENIQAGVLLSCVGSLNAAKLRLADGDTLRSWEKLFEIVSCTGTVSVNGVHLHASISDQEGNVIGGHLNSEGNIIHTTVELVILDLEETMFTREADESTGYSELVVS